MTSTSEKKRVQKSGASDEVAERLGKAKKKDGPNLLRESGSCWRSVTVGWHRQSGQHYCRLTDNRN